MNKSSFQMVGVAVFVWIASTFQMASMAVFAERVQLRLKIEYFAKCIEKDADYYD